LGGSDAVDWRPPKRAPRRQRRPDRGTVQQPRMREVRSSATAKSGRGALERPRPDTGR
jgi:hypothetical protein